METYQQQMDSVAAWAKAESRRLPDLPGSKGERDLVQKWRRDRPRMSEALAQRGALLPLAHVLQNRALEAKKAFLKEGLPPTDAQEQADQWLLQEPESEDDPNHLPPSLRPLDPTTLSAIPNP